MNANGVVRVLAVISALVALIVVGGAATPGHAATSFEITLAPLIGTSDVNVIPQVSYGGKIGYHLHIRNAGDSTTQHGSIVVTSNLGTFSDASDTANCPVNPKDAHQMLCTPFGGTFTPGTTFDVDLRFTAPATGPADGEQVSTVASITVSAQTVGGNKSNGTTLAQSAPVLTNVVENTTKADTFLHGDETAATGNLSSTHPQHFGLQTPSLLLGGPFGLALSIHDNLGQICPTCLGSYTTLTIPSAGLLTTPGNPFYDGTTFNPYSWSMSAQYPSGFKLHNLIHVDNNNVLAVVPGCASIGGAPTAAAPLCWDTLDQVTSKKILTATGRGLENGNWGWN